MDLLTGYGSSSDDDDDDVHHNEQQQQQQLRDDIIKKKSAVDNVDTTSSKMKSSSVFTSQSAATVSTSVEQSDTNNSKKRNKNKTKATLDAEKRKGKKLLKLSAVLPEHIWNQLTGGDARGHAATGGGDNSNSSSIDGSDDDDDDDEVDDAGRRRKNNSMQKKKMMNGNTTTTSTEKTDSGLLGLLQALPKSKNQGNFTSTSGVVYSNNYQEENGDRNTEDRTDEQESVLSKSNDFAASDNAPLGAAFVTATVETVSRRRRKPGDEPTPVKVVDLHGPQKMDSEEPVAVPSRPRAPSAVAPEDTSYSDQLQQRRLHQQRFSSVPRPQARSTNTLLPPPPLPARMQAQYQQQYSQPNYYADPNHYQHEQQIADHPSDQGATTQAPLPTLGGIGGGGGKKKQQSRKRQMEQMLRAGKIDEIQSDHQLEMESNHYRISGDVGGGDKGGYSSHGIKVVPTSSYEASAGTTSASTDVSFKQKNKHQLNSLLANAASLEAARAQNPFHATNSAKSHRASAKRRYGW